MKDHYIEPEYNAVAEARRYVENARTVLLEHGKLNIEENSYEDSKYVRAAGHYLWHSVLLALEAVFHLKKKNNSRVHVERYRQLLANRDRKLLTWVNDAYLTMHLSMDYDGNRSKGNCDDGFRLANEIIDRCEAMID